MLLTMRQYLVLFITHCHVSIASVTVYQVEEPRQRTSGASAVNGSTDTVIDLGDPTATATTAVTSSLLLTEKPCTCFSPTSRKKPRMDAQSRLIRDIFNNYDRRVRPVDNHDSPIQITLTMTLYQLIQVNEPEEYVVINIWMAHTWHDEFLAWNPDEYGGIDNIVVPWEQVWLSDIVLYNGLDMSDGNSEKRINVELSMNRSDLSRATVRFAFPAIYRFSCKMDVYYFPFDRQNCTMIFGSWVYDSRRVDTFPHGFSVKMDNFITNQEWDVVSFETYRHVNLYSCCPYPFVNVQYHLVILRKPLFFLCSYVIPTIIVAFISFIGLFTPSNTTNDREEKISLGISTLLAMSILLLMISDKMPTAGTYVPMMAMFFLLIIVLIACGIALTTTVIFLQRRQLYGSRLSPFARHLFVDIMPKFLMMGQRRSRRQSLTNGMDADSKKYTTSFVRSSETEELLLRDTSHHFEPIQNNNVDHHGCVTGRHLRSAAAAASASEVETGEEFTSEWIIVADVVERSFLMFFVAVLVGLSAVTLIHAMTNPQVMESTNKN